MKIKNAILKEVCGYKSKLPQDTGGEIAFVGRSNVGKSSLLNTLLNRKALARTSSQPGKTQTINFYQINDSFCFVDLPGYGYAKVSLKEKEKWGHFINHYLSESIFLKGICLLVDIRHDPSKEDQIMYDYLLSSEKEAIIVATKVDKIKRSQVQKQISRIRQVLQAPKEQKIFTFSAKTKDGRDELLSYLETLLVEEDNI